MLKENPTIPISENVRLSSTTIFSNFPGQVLHISTDLADSPYSPGFYLPHREQSLWRGLP